MSFNNSIRLLFLSVIVVFATFQESRAGYESARKRLFSESEETSPSAVLAAETPPRRLAKRKRHLPSPVQVLPVQGLVESALCENEVSEKEASEEEVAVAVDETPASYGIRTPKKTRIIEDTFCVTPRSKTLQNAVYFFHNFPGALDFNKIDLANQVVSAQELVDLAAEMRELAKQLKGRGVHIYVGLVGTSDKNADRTVLDRAREHVRACNHGNELRNYRFVRKCAAENQKVYMQASFHNIHPSQLKIVEAYLIKVFGGMEDFGLNSNSGTWYEAKGFFEGIEPFPSSEEIKSENLASLDDFVIAEGTKKYRIRGTDGSFKSELLLTPNSRTKKRSVYLIHDFPGRLQFKKINLRNKAVLKDEFLDSISELQTLAKSLRSQQIHLYVGEVGGSGKNPDRVTLDRANEHVNSCNGDSHQRDYLGFRKCADLGKKLHQQVMIYNVDPKQVFIFEAYLIRLFGGIDDFGWNSNAGHSEDFYRFFGEIDPAELSSPRKPVIETVEDELIFEDLEKSQIIEVST